MLGLFTHIHYFVQLLCKVNFVNTVLHVVAWLIQTYRARLGTLSPSIVCTRCAIRVIKAVLHIGQMKSTWKRLNGLPRLAEPGSNMECES